MAFPYGSNSMFGGGTSQRGMFKFDPSKLNMGLLMGGLGMMGGQNPQQQMQLGMQGGMAGYGMDQDRRERSDKEKREKQWTDALQLGMNDPDSALGNISPSDRALMQANPELAQSVVSGRLSGGTSSLTNDMREYEVAKSQGFPGTFMDYQIQMREAGRNTTTVNTGDFKIPKDYQLLDPENPDAGVTPIPGGPAEQLPAESGARVGLADNFLSQAPALREEVVKGSVTGPWDNVKGRLWSKSDQASTYRKIESGTDALRRMLTGAGMPNAEAADYVRRYLPDSTDDAASATDKLDQLVAELKSMNTALMRGRGGDAQTGEGNLTPRDDGSLDWTP